MGKTTLAECEKKFTAANVAYCNFVDQTAKEKFGSYTAAAKALKRSRAHVQDCIAGRRGLDSARRLAQKMETTAPA